MLLEKSKKHVEPLAREMEAPVFLPLDVSQPGELEAVFAAIEKQWGQLDVLVHSIAWAPKDDLQGGLLDCSAEGFAKAMDVSCHSFIRMARLAAPLMKNGGTMFAMSYYGANKVVSNYNVMGPVKAALEASARYLAYELGPKGITVNLVQPGSTDTDANPADGAAADFQRSLTSLGRYGEPREVANAVVFLASPAASVITGAILTADGGAIA